MYKMKKCLNVLPLFDRLHFVKTKTKNDESVKNAMYNGKENCPFLVGMANGYIWLWIDIVIDFHWMVQALPCKYWNGNVEIRMCENERRMWSIRAAEAVYLAIFTWQYTGVLPHVFTLK